MRLRAVIALMVATFLVSFLWKLLPPPGQSLRPRPHLMSELTHSLTVGGMPTGVVGVEASFVPQGLHPSVEPGGGPALGWAPGSS